MLDQIIAAAGPAGRLILPGVALGFMLLEYLAARLLRHGGRTHDLAESAVSLGIALGRKLVRTLDAAILAVPFLLAYRHRLLDLPSTSPATLALLFLGTELLYYWQHRAAHRVRWLWASHAVHHSATRLNLTAAVRVGWTGNVSGSFLFFVPLAWIGFHPLAIVGMLGLNLLYQFFIHTELGPRLGPLEWLLNTPTHHRVHHASNPSCLDRNYGGILIVFDRLFGTFAEPPAGEPLRYGLAGRAPSRNLLQVAFGEWIAMARDLRRASSPRAGLRVLFGPPGPAPEPARGAAAHLRITPGEPVP